MEKLKVTEMNRLTVEEFREARKTPLRVVLDNVRSMHNVGSVFRTADAFLLEGLDLCGITCCPPHTELHKTALGAEETVSWRHFDDTLECVRTLQQEGYTVLAVEQAKGSTKLPDFQVEPDRKYAIVLGHEVKGVQQSVVDAADGCLEIEQYGMKHSMNVSVTAGIVIYELATALTAIGR